MLQIFVANNTWPQRKEKPILTHALYLDQITRMSVQQFSVLATCKHRSTLYLTGQHFSQSSVFTVSVNGSTPLAATLVKVIGSHNPNPPGAVAAIVRIPFGPIQTGDALLITGLDPSLNPALSATTGNALAPHRVKCDLCKGKTKKQRI
jgi:hypothetical protein